MTTPFQHIKRKLAELWRIADQTARGKAVETVEHEVEELTHIFALLVLGVFVGLPAPPAQITLELMPDLEAELDLMLSKVTTAHDPLGELFSVLGID